MADSLYDRLGGIDAITAVVGSFRDRVAGDDRINLKFARTDLARLTKMLIDQVCEATGGPCRYTGRSMKEAHASMGVTNGEFDALVEDLVATLNQFNIPEAGLLLILGVDTFLDMGRSANQFNVGKAEQDDLLGLLGPMKSEIVEVTSKEVGTPLPDAFQAAPAMRN